MRTPLGNTKNVVDRNRVEIGTYLPGIRNLWRVWDVGIGSHIGHTYLGYTCIPIILLPYSCGFPFGLPTRAQYELSSFRDLPKCLQGRFQLQIKITYCWLKGPWKISVDPNRQLPTSSKTLLSVLFFGLRQRHCHQRHLRFRSGQIAVQGSAGIAFAKAPRASFAITKQPYIDISSQTSRNPEPKLNLKWHIY